MKTFIFSSVFDFHIRMRDIIDVAFLRITQQFITYIVELAICRHMWNMWSGQQ